MYDGRLVYFGRWSSKKVPNIYLFSNRKSWTRDLKPGLYDGSVVCAACTNAMVRISLIRFETKNTRLEILVFTFVTS